MHGVVARQNGQGTWELDKEATLKKRVELRQQRLSECKQWKSGGKIERQMIQDTNFNEEVKEMYQQSLSFDKFRDEFRSFGKLTMII